MQNDSFFQSQEFGEFQEKIPYRGKSWELVFGAARCLVIKMKLLLGRSWLWIPYGPVIGMRDQGTGNSGMEEIFDDIERIAKEERAIFARVEPPLNWREEYTKILKKAWRISPAKTRYTPEHTFVLDLEKSEEEILAQMKPKGRYNISVALRRGVSVEQFVPEGRINCLAHASHVPTVKNRTESGFDAFYKILQKTGSRDGFGIHSKFFYETLLKTFGPKGMSELFLAYYQEKVIGGIIVIFYKDTATYYYGASSYENRNLMAPYLLQWEAIREAKRRGMKTYDFLGIAPPEVIAGPKQSHPWAGITEFKKKFGGREVMYPPAYDVVYRPLEYRTLGLLRKIR